jgi:hypothetical protein
MANEISSNSEESELPSSLAEDNSQTLGNQKFKVDIDETEGEDEYGTRPLFQVPNAQATSLLDTGSQDTYTHETKTPRA